MMSLIDKDMMHLIQMEMLLEEIMSQIKNGNLMGDDYLWHTCRVALMHNRILIDRLYEKPKKEDWEAEL